MMGKFVVAARLALAVFLAVVMVRGMAANFGVALWTLCWTAAIAWWVLDGWVVGVELVLPDDEDNAQGDKEGGPRT